MLGGSCVSGGNSVPRSCPCCSCRCPCCSCRYPSCPCRCCVCLCLCLFWARATNNREIQRERERERENQPRRKKRRERERCATTADLWFNRVDVCDTIDHNNLQSNLCSLSAVRCPLLVLVLVRLLLCFCPYRPSSCPLSRSLLRFPVLFSLRLHDKTR